MVLETLFTPFHAEKHPLELVLLGFLYGTIALFLSLWVFEDQASLVMVFLAVMASLPLFYQTMLYEEKKDNVKTSEWRLIKEHSKEFIFVIFLLIGLTIAFTLWFVVLPENASKIVFHQQLQTINRINTEVSGNTFEELTGNLTQTELFWSIFINNAKVMIFSLFFSLLYGSGAVFILSWNASVIAAAYGSFMALYLKHLASGDNFTYFKVVSLALIRYSIHGIPEILAYVIAGLAGGILSAAIIRQDFYKPKMEKVMVDFVTLLFLALFVVLIAGIIEVYVTPSLFSSAQQNLI